MRFHLPIVALLLTSCDSPTSRAPEFSEDTEALRDTFPYLESDKITAFRHQDWCKVLSYDRGSFTSTISQNCTYISASPPAPFDAEASADLEKIWKLVRSTDTGVYLISKVRYDAYGHVVFGEFDFSSDFVRRRYVFDPGYKLPTDIPNERRHQIIDGDWYYIQEDWN